MRTVLFSFLLIGIAACATEPQQRTLPDGVTVLSESELHEKIVGNTMSGVLRGDPWTEYYALHGEIRGFNNEGPYDGTWTIAGPWMCYDYPGHKYDTCNTIALSGNEAHFFDTEGKPAEWVTGTLELGNPKEL